MRAAAVALSLCLLLSGCRKKTAPEFYRLESDYSVLVTREGDDAYESPELATIVAGLQAISANAAERPRADTLLATIAAETQRVQKERAATAQNAAAPEANADALYAALKRAPTEKPEPVAEVKEPAAEQDAGSQPLEPYRGMSEADFVKTFGGCFQKAGAVTLPDGAKATAQKPLATPACTRWGSAQWVFNDKGLIGQLTQQSETRTTETVKPEPAKPTTAPAPTPIIAVPGRPTSDTNAPPSVDPNAYLKDTPPPTVTPPAP